MVAKIETVGYAFLFLCLHCLKYCFHSNNISKVLVVQNAITKTGFQVCYIVKKMLQYKCNFFLYYRQLHYDYESLFDSSCLSKLFPPLANKNYQNKKQKKTFFQNEFARCFLKIFFDSRFSTVKTSSGCEYSVKKLSCFAISSFSTWLRSEKELSWILLNFKPLFFGFFFGSRSENST